MELVYNFDFDIAALAIDIMLLLIVTIRKALPSKSLTAYRVLLISNLLAVLADIASVFTISYAKQIPVELNYFVNICYYFFHNFTNFLFVMYSLLIENYKTDKKGVRAFWFIFGILILLSIITTPFTGLAFSFDENMVYSSGPLLFLYYGMAVISIIYVIIVKLLVRSQKTDFQVVSHFFFLFFLAASFVFHIFFEKYLIELFGISLGLLVLYISQDNTEKHRYKGMSVFNRLALNDMIQNKMAYHNRIAILFFTPKFSQSQYIKTNSKVIFSIEKVLSRSIKNTLKFYQSHLFIIDDLTFACFTTPELLYRVMDKMKGIFDSPIDVDEMKYTFDMTYGTFIHPGIAKDYDEATQLINGLLKRMQDYEGSAVLESNRHDIINKRYLEIVDCIRKGLDKSSNMTLCYQPIFDNKRNNGLNVEVKILMRDYQGNSIDIKEFLPIAEKNLLVFDLDRFKLLKIVEFLKNPEVKEAGITNVNMNLSSTTMMDEPFFAELKDFVRKNHIPAQNINLEYIDNGDTRDMKLLNQHLSLLKELGFKITLDGFGAAHNDMQYLLNYQFDGVKIDKSLVSSLGVYKDALPILDGLIDLLKKLDKVVTCEGVTTQEQYYFLKKTKVDYIQGPIIGKLLSEAEYIHFIKSQLRNNLDDFNAH